MRDREPVTQTMKASEARQQFSQLLNKVFRGEARVIVEKSGIPVAAIISARDLGVFQRLEEQRRERFKALDETREAFKDVPDEELEREVANALAAVRKKQRTERFKALDESWKAFEGVAPEEIEREVANAVAAARKKSRAQTERAAKAS
ncbi:MAG: type II toxin-antitoxin system prevent-host-death family antitoxin [Chloroflexi bacterium]|nr:type II toxin-antitoxin system prevent-host-death family antitoxin [Chloroflexota bacterium]